MSVVVPAVLQYMDVFSGCAGGSQHYSAVTVSVMWMYSADWKGNGNDNGQILFLLCFTALVFQDELPHTMSTSITTTTAPMVFGYCTLSVISFHGYYN